MNINHAFPDKEESVPKLEEIVSSSNDLENLRSFDIQKFQKLLAEQQLQLVNFFKEIKNNILHPEDVWPKIRHGQMTDDFETWQKITCMDLHVPKEGKIEASFTTTKESINTISMFLVGGGGGSGFTINATIRDLFPQRTTSLRLFTMVKVRNLVYEDGYVRTTILEVGRIGQEDLGTTCKTNEEAQSSSAKAQLDQVIDLFDDLSGRIISEEVINTKQLSIQAKTKAPKLNTDVGFSLAGKITTSTTVKTTFSGGYRHIPYCLEDGSKLPHFWAYEKNPKY
ncbi:unnamed protein product [Didymodactylos carnosus]|uniref:Uncharacterized protein n=1 Tax=Didymodactylos carnosus TaxID=1234261 RepID=A0A814FWJ7_9BILA|nr:unnamed protein product [Didymodactylos carnosus]CAF0986788.1 unnamed protein product [Didymodactylos carnosus]CAF3636077.1 unnamed protein product [Didymodactylos carnosus]CAF3759002.1 unnamed protein product [Didymodactylos carnosus]